MSNRLEIPKPIIPLLNKKKQELNLSDHEIIELLYQLNDKGEKAKIEAWQKGLAELET